MTLREQWIKKIQERRSGGTGDPPKGRWVELGDGEQVWVPERTLALASGER